MVKFSLERKAGCPVQTGWAKAGRKWKLLRTRASLERGSGQWGRGMMATTWVTNQELQLHACMDENPLSRGSRRHLLLVKGEDIRGKEQGTKTKATHAWLLFNLLRNLGFCNTGVSSWGLPDIQQKLTGEVFPAGIPKWAFYCGWVSSVQPPRPPVGIVIFWNKQ